MELRRKTSNTPSRHNKIAIRFRSLTMLFLAINRRHEDRLHRDVEHLAPQAFWSTDLRARVGTSAAMSDACGANKGTNALN